MGLLFFLLLNCFPNGLDFIKVALIQAVRKCPSFLYSWQHNKSFQTLPISYPKNMTVLSPFGIMWLNINVYQFSKIMNSISILCSFSYQGIHFSYWFQRALNPLKLLTICQLFQITFISSPFYYIVFYDIHSVILKWRKLVTSYLPKLGPWIITIMLLHTTMV